MKNNVNSKKSINFINDLKVRNFFPFYIENINNKFFSGFANVYKNKQIKNLPHFVKAQLDADELKKFYKSQDILSHESIGLLINQLIVQFAARLGDNADGLFKSHGINQFGQTIYVQEKFELYDFKIIGDIYNDKRFIFAVDINPDSYLFEFMEQLQIFIFLDEKKKIISGGFSFNWGNDNKPETDENVIERVYLNSLIKLFVSQEIGSISINNMLSLMSESFDVTTTKINKKKKTKGFSNLKGNKTSIDILKEKWEILLSEKILNDVKEFTTKKNTTATQRTAYYKNDLFFSVVNVILISLSIYEELRKYFTNKDPELYLPLLKRTNVPTRVVSENSESDFEFLIRFLKRRYFHFGKSKITEIDNAEDAIEALIRFETFENESFGNMISSYEIIRNSDIPFLDEDADIFINSKDLKVLYLMTMKPDVFGINISNYAFSKYKEINDFIKENDFKDDFKQILEATIDETICEWNYDYVSFINANSESLIIKNNNPIDFASNEYSYEVDNNRKIYNNYVWANVYTQTVLWMIKDIEKEISEQRKTNPRKLRTYLNQLESLRFDRYDAFYGIPQVKNIVTKLMEFNDYNGLNQVLINKTNKEDKLYGKSKERRNIALAFMSTTVYGLLDFFTMVFSVLTVTSSNGVDVASIALQNPENIALISVGSVFAFILFCILIYSVVFPIIKQWIEKWKSKK